MAADLAGQSGCLCVLVRGSVWDGRLLLFPCRQQVCVGPAAGPLSLLPDLREAGSEDAGTEIVVLILRVRMALGLS